MLTLTENAGTVVSDLVSRASETDTAGLRIQQGDNRFDIAIADAPAPSEVVVEQSGARVFMDGPVAQVLDEMTLDAQIDGTGNIRFALAPQL
ncbi:Fe-S cluster assembly protein HesB [Protaetiibacter mangrovi]|uniref:Fe-S cluster assembly protein HesB n=1 Tax=Protaetiibacter mangrovi TaxID=2970926 RepID=A0ABT1ZDI5_9MICO|nr:Fe-S cluster assembly protein HesB [Protaetiibacter mangrovi]MCS0498760.1 Fe-S cluster assembly protein HesB [Protaetiibacter mangrovi]TPX03137.1 Fe-S cluster assembly protein HesB [Schumannella luteola]